jgi:very-short-patch-repair endonuclease
MMWILVLLFLAIVVAVLIAAKKSASIKSGGQDFPYIKKETLLSPAERSFLGVLEQAVGCNYRIFAQVRLADLLAVRTGTDKSIRTRAQNRINAKHADFVLCNKETLEIICAVELDDASHQKESRKVRDIFLEEACRAADLPLARFPAKVSYAIQEVKGSIFALLGAPQKPVSLPVQAEEPKPMPGATKNVISPTAAPSCPKCGGGTDLRTVRSGAHAGNKLWGCKKYPACRGHILLNAR